MLPLLRKKKILSALLCVALAAATLEVRTGLLDRLVQHYKENFFEDLVDKAPVLVNVSIQRAPPGYIDSSDWDYDSVVRLIGLIRESEANLPQPVRRALREFLDGAGRVLPAPSRRFGGMGFLHKARQRAAAVMRRCLGDPSKPGYPKNCPRRGLRRSRGKLLLGARKNGISRLHVPSFPNPNDLYYDEMISIEQPQELDKMGPPPSGAYNASMQDDDIVVISNPVEARLPSGHISIGTLRRILEARAEAARVMPTRPTTTMHLVSTNKTSDVEDATGGDNTTDTGATGDDTGATGDGGDGTGAPGDGGGDGDGTTAEAGGEGEAAEAEEAAE